MKISFDVIDNENIYDFIKYYATVWFDKKGMLEVKLNFDDLSKEHKLALIRHIDKNYEDTVISNFDENNKNLLFSLFEIMNHYDYVDGIFALENNIHYLAIELYKETCQDLINSLCAKISKEEQHKFDKK